MQIDRVDLLGSLCAFVIEKGSLSSEKFLFLTGLDLDEEKLVKLGDQILQFTYKQLGDSCPTIALVNYTPSEMFVHNKKEAVRLIKDWIKEFLGNEEINELRCFLDEPEGFGEDQ